MENRGIILIDGSHLFASILKVRDNRPEYKNKKLNLTKLTEALTRKWGLNLGYLVRAKYYFKKTDKRLKELLTIPKSNEPGTKNHWQIVECGETLTGGVPIEQIVKLDQKYRDYFPRSEKGLDIKLTCDALLLAATGRISNFVFLINDRDYMPLLDSIGSLGGNVYITALDSKEETQEKITNLSDLFLTLDNELPFIFELTKPEPPKQTLSQESPES